MSIIIKNIEKLGQAINLLLCLLLIPSLSCAGPAIITVTSDVISHKSPMTITGSGFGSKSPSAPLVWDATDDDSTTDLDTHYARDSEYSGEFYVLPRKSVCHDTPGETPYVMAYRSNYPKTWVPEGNPGMPHDRITKYLSANHTHCGGKWTSGMANNIVTIPDVDSDYVFAMWWYRVSDTYSEAIAGRDNMKLASPNGCEKGHCGGYLDGRDTYWSICNAHPPAGSDYIYIRNEAGSCTRRNRVPILNPFTRWVHMELVWDNNGVEAYSTDGDDVYGGWCAPGLDDSGSQLHSITIGGYNRFPRANATGNYRFIAGVYVDNTWSRVMLGNAKRWAKCTIREPQPATAWSDTEITVTVNLGALTDDTAYLYVFNAENDANSKGVKVTIGK